jgi:prevent-host-death family protein
VAASQRVTISGKCATLTHMENRVGLRGLQQNASEIVHRAASGESVLITDRGRPVARLVPLTQGNLAGLIAAGQARPARMRLRDLPPPLPAKGPRTLSSILAEQRADER